MKEYAQYKIYYTDYKRQEQFIGHYYLDTVTNEVDLDNLPHKADIAQLLQALRMHDVHIEFDRIIKEDE